MEDVLILLRELDGLSVMGSKIGLFLEQSEQSEWWYGLCLSEWREVDLFMSECVMVNGKLSNPVHFLTPGRTEDRGQFWLMTR